MKLSTPCLLQVHLCQCTCAYNAASLKCTNVSKMICACQLKDNKHATEELKAKRCDTFEIDEVLQTMEAVQPAEVVKAVGSTSSTASGDLTSCYGDLFRDCTTFDKQAELMKESMIHIELQKSMHCTADVKEHILKTLKALDVLIAQSAPDVEVATKHFCCSGLQGLSPPLVEHIESVLETLEDLLECHSSKRGDSVWQRFDHLTVKP